jgi:hypothetical protein
METNDGLVTWKSLVKMTIGFKQRSHRHFCGNGSDQREVPRYCSHGPVRRRREVPRIDSLL